MEFLQNSFLCPKKNLGFFSRVDFQTKNFERVHSVATRSEKKKKTSRGVCEQRQAYCEVFRRFFKQNVYHEVDDLYHDFLEDIKMLRENHVMIKGHEKAAGKNYMTIGKKFKGHL